MQRSSIHSVYNREHRRAEGVVVCFIEGDYCTFLDEDALVVSSITGQRVVQASGHGRVEFHMGGFPAARDQLVHSGKRLVVFRHGPRDQWHRLGLADLYDLSVFVDAHGIAYADALAELKAGTGRSPWVDYIFPRIAGLDFSGMARRYAVGSLGEAKAYFDHPVLGAHYRECCRALLEFAGRKTSAGILGAEGAGKVHASTTLFLRTGFYDAKDLCRRVLDAFYGGEEDPATLSRLGV